jgi:dodecin
MPVSRPRHGNFGVAASGSRRGKARASAGQCRDGGTEEAAMPDSVYRVTEVIGVSGESWEAAAKSAVQTAASTVRDLRVAEVVRQDVVIENGQVSGFRVRLAISFKYESGD